MIKALSRTLEDNTRHPSVTIKLPVFVLPFALSFCALCGGVVDVRGLTSMGAFYSTPHLIYPQEVKGFS